MNEFVPLLNNATTENYLLYLQMLKSVKKIKSVKQLIGLYKFKEKYHTSIEQQFFNLPFRISESIILTSYI